MTDDARGPSTRSVHAGRPDGAQGAPFLPGPVLAAPYHYAGDIETNAAHAYGREGNPTWEAYEAALGSLEDGESVLFASGMAAVSAVVLPVLGPGDVFVAPADGYYSLRDIVERHLRPRGVDVRLVPTDDAAVRDALPGAKLVWLESPSNPLLDEIDLAALIADAHAAGALAAVDNTVATPLRRRPLDLGADFSMSSATKQLTGHSDVLLGVVSARAGEQLAMLRGWRAMTGSIPGPLETWLAHRSLATLALRVERQEANAAALAELLGARDDVAWSRWPGLGCLVSFDLLTAARARAFLTACTLVAEATSFGGLHSSAERRARWGADDVSPGLVRLSAGVEDAADLLADVTSALDVSLSSAG